jgi:prepilin-type N-terminal cleavage/methylation domain-containing protein
MTIWIIEINGLDMLNRNIKGFTLVELSIVIVIIGLIVAGVTAGQSLVQQSKMRAQISQIQQFKTAINSFLLEYMALPGDITKAYDFWGAAFGCTNAPELPSGAGCNGNGNKLIGNVGRASSEGLKFWKQLAYTGRIPGVYTGQGIGANLMEHSGGLNAPLTAFGEGCVTVSDAPNYIMIGNRVTNDTCWDSIISPITAKSIDSKLDDGNSNTGKVRAEAGSSHRFTTPTDCISGGNYALGSSVKACLMYNYF